MNSDKNIISISMFLSINVLYVLLYVFDQCLLQILCSLSIMFLLFSGLLVFLKINKESDVKSTDKIEIISRDKAENIMIFLYEHLNDKLTELRKYLLWDNKVKNISAMIILYFLGKFFSLISFSAFFYLLSWIIFLYYFINENYISKLITATKNLYCDLKEQAKYVYDNIPKLQHLKKNI